MEKRGKFSLTAGLILSYLLVGAYYLNLKFNYLKIPDTVTKAITPWVHAVAGALLVLGAFYIWKANKSEQGN